MAHINMVKGDYVFNQWENESFKAMHEKFNELEGLGYTMAEEEYGCLDIYFNFRKEGEKDIVVTLMCV